MNPQNPRNDQLIHGVFNPTDDVLKATLERLAEKGFTVDQFTWIGPETPPNFTKDKKVVVVLDVTLDTLQATFEFAWEWVKDGQKNSWRHEGMLSDPGNLRLLEASEPFQPFTLRWRRIKLNRTKIKEPVDAWRQKTSPGIALLFVAAQHPEEVKAIDHKRQFAWLINGLECTAPDGEPWQGRPYINYDSNNHEVQLGVIWRDDRLSSPIIFRG